MKLGFLLLYSLKKILKDSEGTLNVSKATYFNNLKMEEMTLAQKETVTTIFNLLKSIWGKQYSTRPEDSA